MKIAVFAAVAMLAGCVTVKTVSGPSGRPAMVLRCGMEPQFCYEKAGELCPKGYAILDQTSGMAIVPTAGGGVFGGSQNNLLIECK